MLKITSTYIENNINFLTTKDAEGNAKFSLKLVNNAIKSVQSTKCRLKKKKARMNADAFNVAMDEVLLTEQLLIDYKNANLNKDKKSYDLTQSEINELDYDDIERYLNNVRSIKSLSQYETTDSSTNDKYLKCIEVEKMLLIARDKTNKDPKINKAIILDIFNDDSIDDAEKLLKIYELVKIDDDDNNDDNNDDDSADI